MMRLSKLQILASKFEDLQMHEDETIANLNTKLCDITNEAYAFNDKYIF